MIGTFCVRIVRGGQVAISRQVAADDLAEGQSTLRRRIGSMRTPTPKPVTADANKDCNSAKKCYPILMWGHGEWR